VEKLTSFWLWFVRFVAVLISDSFLFNWNSSSDSWKQSIRSECDIMFLDFEESIKLIPFKPECSGYYAEKRRNILKIGCQWLWNCSPCPSQLGILNVIDSSRNFMLRPQLLVFAASRGSGACGHSSTCPILGDRFRHSPQVHTSKQVNVSFYHWAGLYTGRNSRSADFCAFCQQYWRCWLWFCKSGGLHGSPNNTSNSC